MVHPLAILLLVLAVMPGCKKRVNPVEAEATGDAEDARTGGDRAAPLAEPAPEPDGDGKSSPEEAARDLVEEWVSVQQEGDFAAYAALYAADFAGVRRSGEKVVELDHAGWLADRKRMFARPMEVQVADLALEADGEGVTAIFTQVWSSGRYTDRGPKRMRLESRGDALRIVREEMLESHILGTGELCERLLATEGPIDHLEVLTPNPRPRLVCVAELGDDHGGRLVILLAGPVDGRWQVLDRESADLGTEPGYEAMKAGRGDDEEVTRAAEVTVVAIAPEENALRLERSESTQAWAHSDRRSVVSLFRVTGDRLDEILSVESEASSGEADRLDSGELDITTKVTRGFYEIEVTRRRSSVQWAAGEEPAEDEVEETRYRWDGSAYKEK